MKQKIKQELLLVVFFSSMSRAKAEQKTAENEEENPNKSNNIQNINRSEKLLFYTLL